MASEKGDSTFAAKILAELPTMEKAVTFAAAHAAIKELRASAMGRYCGRAVSSHIDQILSWLSAGMQRSIMQIPAVETGRLSQAKQRLEFFLRLPDGGADGQPAIGKDAVTAILQQLRAKAEAKETIQYGDLQDLAIFNFLLSVEQRKQRDEMTEQVLTRKRPPPTKATSSSKSSGSSSVEKDISKYYFKR